MSISGDVIRVLQSQYTQRITFSFPAVPYKNERDQRTVAVNPSTYHRVLMAIRSGRIRVKEISRRGEIRISSSGRRFGVGGEYQPGNPGGLLVPTVVGRKEGGRVSFTRLYMLQWVLLIPESIFNGEIVPTTLERLRILLETYPICRE